MLEMASSVAFRTMGSLISSHCPASARHQYRTLHGISTALRSTSVPHIARHQYCTLHDLSTAQQRFRGFAHRTGTPVVCRHERAYLVLSQPKGARSSAVYSAESAGQSPCQSRHRTEKAAAESSPSNRIRSTVCPIFVLILRWRGMLPVVEGLFSCSDGCLGFVALSVDVRKQLSRGLLGDHLLMAVSSAWIERWRDPRLMLL